MQNNKMPFGEHDAAYIFSYGDDMNFKDKSYRISGDTPTSVDFWYPSYPDLGPKTVQYPPSYNMDYAFAQIFGGQRIIPPYLFVAVSCFVGSLVMYFLIRKLYGFEAAVITATALLFSHRTILHYLWGQRHNITAFVFIPIAIYALYKYLDLFYKDKDKISYLYIFVLLSLSIFLIHFGAAVFIIPFAVILPALFFIKHKRVPITKKNLKHYLILIVLIAVVTAPFYPVYFMTSSKIITGKTDFGSLFKWLKIPDNHFSMNPIFFYYPATYMGYWTLALLFVGILLLLKRRGNQDLVLLSGLLTLYVVFHLSSFGLVKADSYRIARFLVVEEYFFYAIMAVAVVSIPSLFNIPKLVRKYLRQTLVILFLVVIVSVQGTAAYKSLKGAYPSVLRITPVQYEFANWVQKNIPEESALHLLGTLTYPKKGFIQILSRRVMDRSDTNPLKRELLFKGIVKDRWKNVPEQFIRGKDWVIPIDYVILDYSDIIAIQDKDRFEKLKQMEQLISENATLIYNKNNIKVYKFD